MFLNRPNGKKFIVNTGKINLKLRESHDINSDIIAELKDGTEVILIPILAVFLLTYLNDKFVMKMQYW